jgi:two-component system copper resistance phosphate regulon response regulator CusR
MRILVVEDEKEIRGFVRKTLEAECYAVDTAGNGKDGLEMAQSGHYDLIVLDNIMPKMNGKDMCQALRRDGKEVPILMLSVKTESTTKVDLLNAGVDDYLTKPFSVDELLARIKALLRRPKHLEKEIYELNDLSVDATRHLVKRGGKEAHLTRQEVTLLVYLPKNKGIMLSRSMLMEHVWDMSADPFSNTIEAHIKSLRKKIDTPGKTKLIHTLPGRGYKIDTDAEE